MALVSKMLRYPNELEAMGLLQGGVITNNGKIENPTEQSIKDSINDIHNYLVSDLLLTSVPSNGELDLGNIADLNLADYAFKNNTFFNYNQVINYGFKVYAFNDILQETKPIFLKVYFGVKNMSPKYNVSNLVCRFIFNLYIEIIYNNNILYTIRPTQSFSNIYDAGNNFDAFYYNKSSESYSDGFYTGDRLFVNLLPNRNCYYSSRSNYFNNNLYSFIKFYIERNDKYIKIRQFTGERNYSWSDSSLYNVSQYNYAFIPYNTQGQLSTNNNFMIPYSDRVITNNELVAFRTLDIDVLTNKVYDNYNVMVGYNSQSSVTNVLVDLSINDTSHKYYLINSNNDLTYTYNTNFSTLLRVE